MKLNRRAIVIIWAGMFCVIASIAVLLFPDISHGEVEQTYVHTVEQGDTLWQYAEQSVVPGSSVQREVDRIVRMNNLQSYELNTGQELILPNPSH